jgi:hypothetical protein
MNYSCQYMVWRLLYQDDYNKALAAGLVKPANDVNAQAAATTAAHTAQAEQPPAQLPNQTPASGASPK